MVSFPVVVSSASFLKKLSGMRLRPMVEVAMTLPFALVESKLLVRFDIAKLVVVADVPVAFWKVKFWRVEEEVRRRDGVVRTSDANVRFAESVNAPLVAMNGMRVAVSEETVRFVVLAVSK